MSYPDSVRYLYALGNELKAGAKFGLERMRTLLDELGNPERGQRFIHVAGTNGKGSTSAMVASVLREAGFKTGLYTSPHLVSPVERIQIDGEPVSEALFAEAFEEVHAAAEQLLERDAIDAHPSYFETVTAMAFLLFKRFAEISVIEVGLGGRLDATNVIQPEVCIITPVSFDHEAFLGHTIQAIAGEKAGILKAGIPAVLASQVPEAEKIFYGVGCGGLIASRTIALDNVQVQTESSTFLVNGAPFLCPLAGRHQLENARTAIAACRQLKIADGTIARGIAKTRWPGRLETIHRSPTIILDGAHNPAGALMLANHVREFYSNREIWMVFAAMRDKALEEVVSTLFPLAQRLILTAPDMPRALRPEALLDLYPDTKAVIAPTAPEAMALALQAPTNAVVVITGSLFLVGEVKALP